MTPILAKAGAVLKQGDKISRHHPDHGAETSGFV
jgi:hypothetical protein